MRKKFINTEEHKTGLIALYKEDLASAGPYMKFVLNKAIRELNMGCKPTRVENWVVKMEKLMRGRI